VHAPLHKQFVSWETLRGLDFANWRQVFHTFIIPVLAYGPTIWFSGKRGQNSLIKPFAGCTKRCRPQDQWRLPPTPGRPLHHFCAIPPVIYTLQKLRFSFIERLTRLSPSCLLRSLPSQDQGAYWPFYVTPLTSLIPTSFPRYVLPLPRYLAYSLVLKPPESEPNKELLAFNKTAASVLDPEFFSLYVGYS